MEEAGWYGGGMPSPAREIQHCANSLGRISGTLDILETKLALMERPEDARAARLLRVSTEELRVSLEAAARPALYERIRSRIYREVYTRIAAGGSARDSREPVRACDDA